MRLLYGPIRIGDGDAYDRAPVEERRLWAHTYEYFPGGGGSMGFLLDVFPCMLKNICML